MNCEIISVGTELLLGEIVNLDAQTISQGLSEQGINVYYHTVVGDNPERLRQALAIAKERADMIITTGGLGPTADDLTKETIAAAFGKKLVMDPVQQKRLHERMGARMTPNNEKQAVLPEGCTVLENDWGTAPGCAFEADGCRVIMLPGPPRECAPMFRERVLPYLESLHEGVIRSRYIKIFGMGESEMESRLSYLMDRLQNPTAAPYAKEGECLVRVTAKAPTEAEAYAMCEPVVREVCEVLGDVVYGVDVQSLEQVVVEGLRKRGMTAALAESCTGGLIARRITSVPGASEVFGCGLVTYSNEMKMQLLGVSPETLAAHGAVSPETAIEMARGARKVGRADVGVGVTGIAGPGGGTAQKPVGLFYAAISTPQGEQVIERQRRNSTRERVQLYASSCALDLIRRTVLK
ncbi:MAG TPA: competence/damage-inducible protein A [Candidatus Ventrousia excrementavium]|uniref:Putative competence-damage inducible protein n=1 Tax=Candidatus Ventrousia excrementavium TaxID=2840961 RepID=A0A9D1IUU2_9CLOT|nr:competence/damage-inducible protein A [Candidatus Ventrousia excrementavium]